MRTTLTLDDDVATKLEREVRRSGEPLKVTVNRLLRAALNARTPKTQVAPFVVTARPLGLSPGKDYDDIELLLDLAEGPGRR